MEPTAYTLMNKETPLCGFVIEGEGELELCRITKVRGKLPLWCEPLSAWVGNRSASLTASFSPPRNSDASPSAYS